MTAFEMRISDWSSDVCSSDLSCRFLCIAFLPSAGSTGIRGFPLNCPLSGALEGSSNVRRRLQSSSAWANIAIAGAGGLFDDRLTVPKVQRSEERRGGNEGGRQCRFRGWPYQ